MKKHSFLFFALTLVLGLIIGGVAIGSYLQKTVSNTIQIVMMQNRADLEERVFHAYLNEGPQIAIWALENLENILKEQLEILVSDRQLIQKDMVLTYARLALLYKREGNIKKYVWKRGTLVRK